MKEKHKAVVTMVVAFHSYHEFRSTDELDGFVKGVRLSAKCFTNQVLRVFTQQDLDDQLQDANLDADVRARVEMCLR